MLLNFGSPVIILDKCENNKLDILSDAIIHPTYFMIAFLRFEIGLQKLPGNTVIVDNLEVFNVTR